MLINEQLELSRELGLLSSIRENGDGGAIAKCLALDGSKRWHILNQHDAHLIARLIEEVVLDFDLHYWSVRAHDFRVETLLTCLRNILNPSFFNAFKSYTIASLFGGT